MGRYCNCLLISFYNSVYYYATYNEIGKKVGAIDLPNDRRVNKKPMPRLRRFSSNCWFFCISYLFTNCDELRAHNRSIWNGKLLY